MVGVGRGCDRFYPLLILRALVKIHQIQTADRHPSPIPPNGRPILTSRKPIYSEGWLRKTNALVEVIRRGLMVPTPSVWLIPRGEEQFVGQGKPPEKSLRQNGAGGIGDR
jgi:hypothetical protein